MLLELAASVMSFCDDDMKPRMLENFPHPQLLDSYVTVSWRMWKRKLYELYVLEKMDEPTTERCGVVVSKSASYSGCHVFDTWRGGLLSWFFRGFCSDSACKCSLISQQLFSSTFFLIHNHPALRCRGVKSVVKCTSKHKNWRLGTWISSFCLCNLEMPSWEVWHVVDGITAVLWRYVCLSACVSCYVLPILRT